MGHVIARHAAIREEQARHADLGSRVFTDVVSDPEKARWRSPNRNWRWRASRAPRNSRPTPSASASPRAPATILMARCASSPRWSTIPSSSRSRPAPSIRARPTFSPRIRRRRSASPTRCANARQYSGATGSTAAGTRARQGSPTSPASTASCSARIRAKASCAAAASCIRGSALPLPPRGLRPRQHGAGGARRQARRQSGIAARCRARAGRADARRLSHLRLDREIDAATVEDITINGFPGATAAAKGDQWDFRLYAIRFGSDVYRFIFAASTARRNRPYLPRVDRHLPPHEPRRDRGGQTAAAANRHRRPRRHRRENRAIRSRRRVSRNRTIAVNWVRKILFGP